jgi:hypothetical protein
LFSNLASIPTTDDLLEETPLLNELYGSVKKILSSSLMVAGRAEGIDKVESFLEKQEKFNAEQKALEAKQRAEKIAELNR